mmetsp:Transcript_54395/g.129633  ORF Transcript_54395/g.129633 Transcript_54395/m.129633 type:complete len:102 (+) Transcript_54395:56-361(+)
MRTSTLTITVPRRVGSYKMMLESETAVLFCRLPASFGVNITSAGMPRSRCLFLGKSAKLTVGKIICDAKEPPKWTLLDAITGVTLSVSSGPPVLELALWYG